MALINTSVPNLIQGVSQQPDATRFDGQCEEQINALSSVAEGLKKRPNTVHVARMLESALATDSFVHFINRSASEKYVVIHDGTKLQAWNILTGTEASINGATGGYTPVSESYLDSLSPRQDLKGLTVADTTFVLNTRKGVALDQTLTPALPKEALVYIKQGDYRKKYQVDVTVNITNPAGFTEATTTATLQRYTYETEELSNERFVYYYRWRISSIQINTGGSGYYALPDLNIASNLEVYQDAGYDVTALSGTAIATIVNTGTQGDYAGEGFRQESGSAFFADRYYGETPPVISISIPASAGADAANGLDISAFIWSGDDNNPDSANSDYIASWLTGTTTATYKSGDDQSMIEGSPSLSDYFTVTLNGGLIKLTQNASWEGDFTISTTDSLSDTGMSSVYKEVSTITDLPARAFNNFKVKVIGDADLNQDDYYVEFQTADGADVGVGSWVECAGFAIEQGFAASTMPVSITNDDFDSFVISEINYSPRTAGDKLSNPNPSFVGSEITNLFFFKNRLGFLSRDNVILSEAGLGAPNENGEFSYNFFRTTVTSLLDSGPIDVSVSSTRVTTLESAVGFQENLVLFSKTGQFVLKGGDLLTPKTVSITPATNFDYDETVPPLALGSFIYYPFKRGAFTGLREFTVNSSTDNFDSAEVTEHVPAYIPSNIIAMKGTTSEDMMALLSSDDPSTLYVYHYFWNNNQKVLSAWSKFTMDGEIRGMEFIESTLYLVVVYNGETSIVTMSLESGLKDAAGYVTHLDLRIANTVTAGNATITLPYTPEDDAVQVYTTDGLSLQCSNVGATVTLSNAVSSDTDVWVGLPYTMKYTFSEQLFKAPAGNGKSPSNAAKMLIRNGAIYYADSAYFKVKVTPKFRDTYENFFTPDVVGSSTIGSLTLDSGFYRFPVFTKPQDTVISIENDSALPSTFQSAEFESFLHSRSNRYG